LAYLELETALMIACKLNVPKVVLSYLQYLKNSSASCELNVFDGENGTALTYAARNGNLQVVSELISLNASANFSSPYHVPLIEAVYSHNLDIVELLLKHGANVNEQDAKGNSALHVAITADKHRIVQLLLQHDADPNLPNARKQSPLHLAVEATKRQTNRSFRVERLLVKAGANLNATDYFGKVLYN
jgi:ankyrin repeat protein